MPYKYNPFTGNFDYYESSVTTAPGGSDTQLQYNNGGAFGGISESVYNDATAGSGVDETLFTLSKTLSATGVDVGTDFKLDSNILTVDGSFVGTGNDGGGVYTAKYNQLIFSHDIDNTAAGITSHNIYGSNSVVTSQGSPSIKGVADTSVSFYGHAATANVFLTVPTGGDSPQINIYGGYNVAYSQVSVVAPENPYIILVGTYGYASRNGGAVPDTTYGGYFVGAGGIVNYGVQAQGSTAAINALGHILPNTNNTYTLGNTSLRMSKLWSTNADFSGTLTIGSDTAMSRRAANILAMASGDSFEVPANLAVGTTVNTNYTASFYRTEASSTSASVYSGHFQLVLNGGVNASTSFPAALRYRTDVQSGANAVNYAAGAQALLQVTNSHSGVANNLTGADYSVRWNTNQAGATSNAIIGGNFVVTADSATNQGTIAVIRGGYFGGGLPIGSSSTVTGRLVGGEFYMTVPSAMLTGSALAANMYLRNPTVAGLGSPFPGGLYHIYMEDLSATTSSGTKYPVMFAGTSNDLNRAGIWWGTDANNVGLGRVANNTLGLASGDSFQLTAAGLVFSGTSTSNTISWNNDLILSRFTTATLSVGTSGGASASYEVVVGSGITVQAYDRNTSAYASLNMDGSLINLRPSGTTMLTADGTNGLTLGASGGKVGLYGVTPVVRATTAGAAATFVANTSGIANDTATWDGYTIGQLFKAARNVGMLT